jgi:hypothetical protein
MRIVTPADPPTITQDLLDYLDYTFSNSLPRLEDLPVDPQAIAASVGAREVIEHLRAVMVNQHQELDDG